jgi:dUTP pyrophosphatase
MKIKIKKLNLNAILPTQATKGDAGYDLYSIDDAPLFGSQRRLFKTGIAVEIPEGYYGRIAPRSGLALKQGIDVLGGVIDASYRGEIGVILVNTTAKGDELQITHIKKGDKIAQLIIEKCHQVEWEEVKELAETDRGAGGFGSTGQ